MFPESLQAHDTVVPLSGRLRPLVARAPMTFFRTGEVDSLVLRNTVLSTTWTPTTSLQLLTRFFKYLLLAQAPCVMFHVCISCFWWYHPASRFKLSFLHLH
jgi:hypothetical protein